MAGYVYGGPRRDQPGDRAPAEQRIIDAAIDLWGETGFDGVSLKAIARQAEVSAPLIIHHFGSKAGLRTACDEYATDRFRLAKTEGVERGDDLDPGYLLGAMHDHQPVFRYLLRAFTAGGPEVDRLFDQLIDDSLEYTAHAEEQGLVNPSRNPRHRAAVMFAMSFGALTMHRQLKRLIGVSPLEDPPEQWGPYLAAVSEILLGSVLAAEAYSHLVDLDLDADERTKGTTDE